MSLRLNKLTIIIIFCLFQVLNCSKIINDFSQLNETTVSDIYYPTSVEEINSIVQTAKKLNKKISVAGKRHSQGGHAFYQDNIVIDIKNFNKIIKLNVKQKIITVQTGATWEQIQEFINPHKLAIKVMQTTQIFTIGGSLSVNAHGRDPKFGPLIETIKAIRIMLASGEIVNASRTENHELFKLAIGGYGLFGIILEADIELTDNVLYKKKSKIINVKDYLSFIKDDVINNPKIGLHYGFVSLAPYNFFNEILTVNLIEKKSYKKISSSVYKLKEEKFVDILKKCVDFKRKSNFFNLLSETYGWPFIIMREKLSSTTCRNNAMRHPVKSVEHVATTYTDSLQSYLIPLNSFVNFMNFFKKYAYEKSLKVMFVFTRYIPKNSESFLNYTTDDFFEIVIFISHGTKDKDITHLKQWTQRIINKVLSYGGKFYLPVRLNASYEQLHQAYPQIEDFFAKKKQYDPNELFINNFYMYYSKKSQ